MSLLGKEWYAEYIDYKDGYKAGYAIGERETLREILSLMNAYDSDGQYEGSSADWDSLKDDVANMLKEKEEVDE